MISHSFTMQWTHFKVDVYIKFIQSCRQHACDLGERILFSTDTSAIANQFIYDIFIFNIQIIMCNIATTNMNLVIAVIFYSFIVIRDPTICHY